MYLHEITQQLCLMSFAQQLATQRTCIIPTQDVSYGIHSVNCKKDRLFFAHQVSRELLGNHVKVER